MKWLNRLAAAITRKKQLPKRTAARRRLLIEQFEPRCLLTTAGDDDFWLLAGTPFSAPFYYSPGDVGLLANDSCNRPEEEYCYGYLDSGTSYGSLDQNWGDDARLAFENGMPFTYTPASAGTDSFSYSISGYDGNDSATVTFHIVEANADTNTTAIDTAVNFSPLSNDTGIDSVYWDILPSYGSISGDYYYPNPGSHCVDTFTYLGIANRYINGNLDPLYTPPTTVTITTGGGNSPPNAANDSYSIRPNQTLSTENVLDNDSDSDDSLGTPTLLTDVSHGSLTFNSDGTFSYTPSNNFVGTDSFTYRIADGCEHRDATVTINVTNSAPIGVNDVYSIPVANPANTLSKDAAHGVLSNDLDADEDALEIATVTGINPGSIGSPVPTPHGTVTLHEDGSFTYTPGNNYHGSDSFFYTATDGIATSSVVTVTIHMNSVPVTPGNTGADTVHDVPIVQSSSRIMANVYDVDNDALSVHLVSDVANGTLDLDPDGSYVYTPNELFHGLDAFSYKIGDGYGYSETRVHSIYVNPAADDVYYASKNTTLNVPVTQGVLVNDVGLLFNCSPSCPKFASHGQVTLYEDGSFTYVPDLNHTGPDSFIYEIWDETRGTGGFGTVFITVQP